MNLINIFSTYKRKKEYYTFLKELDLIYEYAPVDFGGGCSYDKALILGFLIKEYNIKCTADVGVYRGRSLFPQSLSHKLFTSGVAYAIDPYDNTAAIQVDRLDIIEELKDFAKNTNFDNIYNDTKNIINNFKLHKNTIFYRCTSQDACNILKCDKTKLGLIHIDGNHDTKYVKQDVLCYSSILEDDGFIILDDISWESVKPAYEYLQKQFTLIGECVNRSNDFAVFINARSAEYTHIEECKMLFKELISYKYK
jgi:hypothetical protein